MLAVAAFAAAMAVLHYSTPRVATAIIVGTPVTALVAACLAVGTRQPARSFWLGFVVACSGFFVLDELARRRLIGPDIFTRRLVAVAENALPEIVHRGHPGTTRYFRSGGRFPVYYYRFGADGKRTGHGQMTIEQAQGDGDFDGVTFLGQLPHIDNVPTSYMRSKMLPYVLAVGVGLLGGLLSYLARRRTMASTGAADTAS